MSLFDIQAASGVKNVLIIETNDGNDIAFAVERKIIEDVEAKSIQILHTIDLANDDGNTDEVGLVSSLSRCA